MSLYHRMLIYFWFTLGCAPRGLTQTLDHTSPRCTTLSTQNKIPTVCANIVSSGAGRRTTWPHLYGNLNIIRESFKLHEGVFHWCFFFIKLNERHLSLQDCDLRTQHMAFDLLNSMFSVLILKEIPHDGYKHDKICVKVNGAEKTTLFVAVSMIWFLHVQILYGPNQGWKSSDVAV